MTSVTVPRKSVAKKARPAQKIATGEVTTKAAKKAKKEKKAEGKVKVVRDSFTMPQADYNLIAELKLKAQTADLHAKKSELLRAGLRLLSKLSAAQLKRAVASLEKIKTGRPRKA